MKQTSFFAAVAVVTLLLAGQASALKVAGEKVVTLESLDDYATCQTQSSAGTWCHEALKDWVKAHPSDAFKAGKLTRLHMNHWVAVPFFAQAFEKKAGQCNDPDVSLALKSAFGMPSDEAVVKQAKAIAFTHCLKELKGNFEGWAAEGSYEKANLCPDLGTQGIAAAACST